MQNIAIFGATGSIGGSTLDVLSHYKDRYRVFALTANSRVEELVRLCESHHPRIALVADESKKDELASSLKTRGLTDIEVWAGESDLARRQEKPLEKFREQRFILWRQEKSSPQPEAQ